MTLDTSFRRQQVEGRGLRAEATPRTSTPYTERLAMLSNSGTFRGRGKNYRKKNTRYHISLLGSKLKGGA